MTGEEILALFYDNLVYKKNGKSLEVYFLSVLTIIFYLSYFILIFVGPR